MTKLNQVIAIEKGVKSKAYKAFTEAHRTASNAELFLGHTRKFQPKDDDTERLPDDNMKVRKNASDLLRDAANSLTDLFDITATKDAANCKAVANVSVDGKVLLEKVPATNLLFLEKQLTDFHTFVAGLPELDPSYDWTLDEQASVYKTEPQVTTKTKKLQKALVLYPATDKHPAQTQMVSEDVIIGQWNQVKMSGALPPKSKQSLLAKVEKLQKAVKFAREEANGITCEQVETGKKIFDYLLS